MTDLDGSGVGLLASRLAELDDIEACAELCCEFFITPERDLVSIYLMRSGRLRRYASVGYWQALDGFPPGAGVIANTTVTGQPHLIDVATSEMYLMAAQCAVSEACVPIFCDDVSIGALNLESAAPIEAAILDEMATVAKILGDRISELGGVAEPRGWQLLADRAASFTAVRDEAEAIRTALEVATALTAYDSAMFVADRAGDLLPIAAHGTASESLLALSDDALTTIGRWVAAPKSCYTVGDPSAPGFTGHDTLRVDGVSSLAITAVDDGESRIGFLVVARQWREMPHQDQVEQLEVLAALLGGAIRNARHVEELLAQTRRDPLTGLGHSKAFDERLKSLHSDEARATAVFSIDIDRFKSVNDTLGHDEGDRQLKAVADALRSALRGNDSVFRVGGDEFAVVVSVDDEQQARAVGERLVQVVRAVGPSVSAGGAVASYGGVSHRDVFVLADEALYAAKRLGRNQLVMRDEGLS